jgi:hypothetical protein
LAGQPAGIREDALTEKNNRAEDLRKKLEVLFTSQNHGTSDGLISIPATFLRVTVPV